MNTRKSTPACSSPSISTKAAASVPWAAALLLLSGCAGPTHVPGQVTTLGALKVGRSLYIGRCGSCHSLKEPGFLTPAEWPDMVAHMAENAKINEDQQRAITQYLVAVSAALHEGSEAPASGTPPTQPPGP
jgi:mono/diheme cytochrome c family protein